MGERGDVGDEEFGREGGVAWTNGRTVAGRQVVVRRGCYAFEAASVVWNPPSSSVVPRGSRRLELRRDLERFGKME